MNPNTQTSTSATLLLRLRDLNDQEAWDDFVERYAPQIFRWCRQNSLQESDAGDVTQEVLGKLVSAMRSFEYHPGKGSFRGWLKTVTRNTVIDLSRRWEQRVRGSGDTIVNESLLQLCEPERLDSLAARIEAQYEQELLAEAESRVKLRVKPQTWEAYRLTAREDVPAAEAALKLGMPISEVYVSKSRVIKHLKQEVARLNPNEDE